MDKKKATRGRVLVVGMKLNSECRERLTWIVARLTVPGDHVIAVHVLQPSSSASSSALSSELDPATREELDETFQGVLGVYQGLCTLKQIKLDIKVVVGASVKEALVDAAKLEEATKLILGTSKFLPTGLSTSLAKYCLKRLSNTCSVTIIDRGKVIFERPGYISTIEKAAMTCGQTCTPGVIQKKMKILNCSSPRVSESSSTENSPETNTSSRCSVVSETNFSESERSFPASPVSVLHSTIGPGLPDEDRKSFSLNAVRASGSSDSPSCSSSSQETVTFVDDEDTSPKHGWPLCAISLDKVTSSPSSSRTPDRELSVVNWALQLPNRSRHLTKPYSARASVSSCNSATESPQFRGNKLLKCTSTPENHLRNWRPADENLDEQKVSLYEKLQALCSENTVSVNFSVEELEAATCNFSPENFVGRGGCSKVYRGVLSNGQMVAVKCLNEVTSDTEHELATEVEILTTLRHRNVISLLGYCVSGRNRMLVYNFATNGNLEQRLHGENTKTAPLDWNSRQKIAVGAAEALEYLHDGCPRPVIHRDVKSSNILLSSSNEALVSDFGLAKWAPTTVPYITCTDVVGTFGYLAPEYFMFGKLNEKTDVYSFGVVLLELITGRHPISASSPKGQENLVIWGRSLLEAGNMEKLVDPRLNDEYDVHQMRHMILAAALCLRQSPQLRPRMRRISRLLSGDEENTFLWANHELSISKELDEEHYSTATSDSDIRTHLALAMVGVDDDIASECDQSSIDFVNSRKSLEDYLGGRYSRSSSLE